MKLHKSLLTVLLFYATTNGMVQAGIIALHSGSADPTTEGWTANPGSENPLNVSVGAINDGGTQAWFVDDNSTANGSIFIYSKSVSDSEIAIGNANGWTLSTRLRIASDEELSFNGSPFAAYRDGSKNWEMFFGLNTSGDTTVQLLTSFSPTQTGPVHTLSGNSTFNTFSLVYDPIAANADLFVNGTEVLSDYVGAAIAQKSVLWGAGRSPDQGQGNFNSVSFSTVPEPSSLALLGMGSLCFLCYAWRWNRKPAM